MVTVIVAIACAACNIVTTYVAMPNYVIVCCILGTVVQDEEHIYITLGLFITYTILSIIGIIFATICLVFNLWFRNQKYVHTYSLR